MRRGFWLALGSTLGLGGMVFFSSRRASAATSTAPGPGSSSATPVPPSDLGPLPTASEVEGDLLSNWGDTPVDLRPLFVKMEEASKIVGSSRIFAVIASRESSFLATAHNGNAEDEQDERDSSRAAYANGKAKNPPLLHGEDAAEFGSGGLFGQLAPYFLWTGVPEVGKKAPLLGARPELVFEPRAAAFAACVYLQRLLAHYRVDDLADIKAGWANPSLLGTKRGSTKYDEVRARFLEDAKSLGIDLSDTGTIPPKLSAAAWPGVPAVFAALVGALPKDLA